VREARSSFFAHGQRGYDSVPIYAISVPFCHAGEVAKHSPAAMQRLAGQRVTHRKVFCQLLSYRGKTVALGRRDRLPRAMRSQAGRRAGKSPAYVEKIYFSCSPPPKKLSRQPVLNDYLGGLKSKRLLGKEKPKR
jgi:hypothetical protein